LAKAFQIQQRGVLQILVLAEQFRIFSLKLVQPGEAALDYFHFIDSRVRP
jgi:hypothetical protein